jgi:hypothetical protein
MESRKEYMDIKLLYRGGGGGGGGRRYLIITLY